MPAALKRKRAEQRGQQRQDQKTVVSDGGSDGGSDDESEPKDAAEDVEDNAQDNADDSRHPSSKLPSASELRAINEARTLFKDNTFKYQLEALLTSIRPKTSHTPPLERSLQKLYTHLTGLPSIVPVHPLEADDALHTLNADARVAIPYPPPAPSQSTAWKVAFEPPTAMNVVGSWSDDLAVRKPDGAPFGVDVVVEMPASLFQEKDYRNVRFFHKRAFYLACLAAALSSAQAAFSMDVTYESAEDDVRRTTLLLTPRKDASEHDFTKLRAAIRVIPVMPDTAPVPVQRLGPAHANIRTSSTPDESLPTPYYNSTLALSLEHTSRTRLLGAHTLAGAAPSFGDALALLRVWANQRGFSSGASVGDAGAGRWCVRGFEGLGAWWACVLEVLVFGEEPRAGIVKGRGKGKGTVGRGLSSYQLFRAALDFLSKRDFGNEPVMMRVVERGQKFDLGGWTAHHDAVFVDASGAVNMLAGVPANSLELLRHDARCTLDALNADAGVDASEDPFRAAFLMDMRSPHARFDVVIRINLAGIHVAPSSGTDPADFPSPQAAALHALATTARKALNTRARAFALLHSHSTPRALDTPHPAPLSTATLGIVLDPAHAGRLVDHAPTEDEGLDAFRAFWGAKAELRRFRDGAIHHSCVWDDGDRDSVPARVVCYALERHLGLDAADVCVLGADWGELVRPVAVRGRGEGSWSGAMGAFEGFVKALRALDDEALPLALVSAQPCAPALRYTSVFPPSPVPSTSSILHPSTANLPAFDVVLRLERSSRWPDDVRAIGRVKMALLEGIARGLGGGARVVLEEAEGDAALEVVVDGWAFHARIAHDREAKLLQETHTPPATRALAQYERRFTHAPAHHSAVLALHHTHAAYAPTVRLVCRWLGAHWLSTRVRAEAVELLCAGVFLRAGAGGDAPASAKRGFVSVVRWLGTWEGMTYVPIYEVVRGDAAKGAEEKAKEKGTHKVEAGRGSWRLVTAEDPGGAVWCEDVSVAVAARVRAVARATARCLDEGTQTFSPLFEHPTEDYDFLIELDSGAVSRYWENIHAAPAVWARPGYANLINDEEQPVRVAFNPAEMYFRDLQKIYGDTVELFYDIYGGTTIGGVWNPTVAGAERHAWRVFLGFSSLPVAPQHKKEKPGVKFNVEGVLAEMLRMGEGLVAKITVRD